MVSKTQRIGVTNMGIKNLPILIIRRVENITQLQEQRLDSLQNSLPPRESLWSLPTGSCSQSSFAQNRYFAMGVAMWGQLHRTLSFWQSVLTTVVSDWVSMVHLFELQVLCPFPDAYVALFSPAVPDEVRQSHKIKVTYSDIIFFGSCTSGQTEPGVNFWPDWFLNGL